MCPLFTSERKKTCVQKSPAFERKKKKDVSKNKKARLFFSTERKKTRVQKYPAVFFQPK